MIDGVLSFCMIAKNEERDLPKCLDSVRHLAGELIVVDTGSTNRTAALAAEYGARVIPFDFTTVDFAAARNCAIGHARGRWILMLDADETLDAAGAPAVEKLVAEDRNAGYFLERHNRSTSSHGPGSSSEPGSSRELAPDIPFRDFVVRLFPNRPGIRYRGPIYLSLVARRSEPRFW